MAYTETTKTSYGQRVGNSFKGIGAGVLLFILGTVLLWWNEGRAVRTTKMLREAQGVTVEMQDISTVDPRFEGKLVHAVGMTWTQDFLVDPDFGFGAVAVSIERDVAYYQWVENASSRTKDKIGGGQETVTTYTYEKKWVDEPVNSSAFHDPQYQNVNKTLARYEHSRICAQHVTFGSYRLSPEQISSISGSRPMEVSLSEEKVASLNRELDSGRMSRQEMVCSNGNVLYLGAGANAPEIGDVRITFTKVLPAEVSLIARVQGDTFTGFTAKNGKRFSALVMGNHTADEMYESEHQANKILLWIFRIVGILLVVTGLKSIFNFIETLAKILPFVANILGWGVGLVCWIVGLAWSFIVIAIAWLRYRPVLGITLLVLAAALIFFLVSRRKKKSSGPASSVQ